MKVFITGAAGMIGFHLAQRLLDAGHDVMGVDDYNSLYYSYVLKMERSKIIKKQGAGVLTGDFVHSLHYKPDIVVHLAAHAAVRHSMEQPHPYFENNICKTQSLIHQMEMLDIKRVIYASTSCVQHGQPLPWKESDRPGHQNNPYGMSKRVNECQFISSTIPVAIGLRFFTAYGPWGRPDMALHMFTDAMMRNEKLIAYNNGNMKRDFTYVQDVVDGVMLMIDHAMSVDSSKEIYNIGYGQQVELMDFIKLIAKKLDKSPKIDYRSPHPADVLETWSDTSKIQSLGWKPTTDIEEGVTKFIEWYKDYYRC
jgi:UDP-glucuronate 4-epimerase